MFPDEGEPVFVEVNFQLVGQTSHF
jgi:hypothetical protein